MKRTMTWLGTLLVVGLSGNAFAEPPKKPAVDDTVNKIRPIDERVKERPRPEYRTMPIRTMKTPGLLLMEKKHYDQGRLMKVEDGYLFYAVELQKPTREKMAEFRKVALSQIPTEEVRAVPIDQRTITRSMIKNRMGKDVRLEIKRDQRDGRAYVTNLLLPE